MLGQSTINHATRPIDHIVGEHIDGLGEDYKIVPMAKWADHQMFEEACKRATYAFKKAGVVNPQFSADTIIVQEYYDRDRIAFIFAHFGRKAFQATPNWLYHVCVIRLTAPLKAHLVLTGRWSKETRH